MNVTTLFQNARTNRPDAERGSAGMMALFVIGLMMLLFIWILMGGVFDNIKGVHNTTSNLGDDFPVSDERVFALNFMTMGMYVMPLLGIFLPLVFYAIMMSFRKGSGGFDGGWG